MKFLTIQISMMMGFATSALAADSIQESLQIRDPQERLAQLKNVSSKKLRQSALDKTQNLATRWNAFMAVVHLEGEKAQSWVRTAMNNEAWYLRDAALKAMLKINPEIAQQEARRLLSDESMVVRTSAVDVLKSTRDMTSIDLLWSQLENKKNFRGSQSLWIRRRVTEALADMPRPGDEQKFFKLLSDKDEKLYGPALSGFETLTGKRFGKASDMLTNRIQEAKKWFTSSQRKTANE